MWGLKGNEQKKNTLEVKMVKARISDGLEKKTWQKCHDLGQTLIVHKTQAKNEL